MYVNHSLHIIKILAIIAFLKLHGSVKFHPLHTLSNNVVYLMKTYTGELHVFIPKMSIEDPLVQITCITW